MFPYTHTGGHMYRFVIKIIVMRGVGRVIIPADSRRMTSRTKQVDNCATTIAAD